MTLPGTRLQGQEYCRRTHHVSYAFDDRYIDNGCRVHETYLAAEDCHG